MLIRQIWQSFYETYFVASFFEGFSHSNLFFRFAYFCMTFWKRPYGSRFVCYKQNLSVIVQHKTTRLDGFAFTVSNLYSAQPATPLAEVKISGRGDNNIIL